MTDLESELFNLQVPVDEGCTLVHVANYDLS